MTKPNPDNPVKPELRENPRAASLWRSRELARLNEMAEEIRAEKRAAEDGR